jgi:predicted Zn-dependent protease
VRQTTLTFQPRAWLAGVILLLAAAACSVNPVTGQRELSLISEEQEIALGGQASQQVAQSLGLVENEALQRYVSDIGHTLAARSERPELPWSFAVVDDPTPNAFALPGGYIFVTRGLATLLSSEAQLAGVLGHEIGHVTARHSVSQMSRAQLAQLGLGLGMILSPEVAQLGDLLGTGLQLLFLKYGRDDERQSDELGFRYMLDAGYEVDEMAGVFRALLAASEMAGQSPLPNWAASHPAEAERIETAERRAAEIDPARNLRAGRDEHLDAIEGTIYGDNPRHGFFRGDWFYHPELIFRFRVPADWQRQNLTNVVQAVSREQDAAVELSIVPARAPADAANAFLSNEAVAAVGSRRETVNGKSAVVSEFRAQSQGGVVRGYVAHIAHGDLVYQLATYAPEPRFQARARELQAIVTSFSDVDDPQILGVQPRRIEIVALPRAMTLAEFARQYPSAVSEEELALLNHVTAGATITAGTRLKRVVE